MGKVCNYVTLLTFLVALLTKLGFITRVYVTELLLFLLALFVIAFGTALAIRQFHEPALQTYISKAPGRRRSSLLKKHLKTMDADASGINRLQGLSESQLIAQAYSTEPTEEAVPASPPAQANGGRTFGTTDRAQLAPLPPLPPQPTRHHQHVHSQLGVPPLYALEEPGTTTSTLSTTFNALLQRASSAERHSSGRHSSRRHDVQLNSSGSAYAAALQVTQRPSTDDAMTVAMTVPLSESAASTPYSLTAGFIQEHARADPPAPPLPPGPE
jgi:hypothetical protein